MYEHLLKSKALSSVLSAMDGASGAALQFVTYLKKLSNHPRLLHGSDETADMATELRTLIAEEPFNPQASGTHALLTVAAYAPA